MREISFSIPQRKKLHFRIVQYTFSGGLSTLGAQVINPATNSVEYELPSSDIAQVIRTPVPEKGSKQYNFIFIPSTTSTYEPILFTVPATPLKGGTYTFPTSTSTLEDALSHVLTQHSLSLTLPDEKEFASATPEAHRKSEKAYHVKAFRGSKDGFLFFLSSGTFFGFKKPLLFLPFDDIESVSYTSVLQRTFNLNITYRKPGSEGEDADTEEIEFSMLDQSDHNGINDYVQRHGLHNASLAAGRRAKSLNKKKAATNGTSNDAAVNGADDEDDGRTEIEKVEAQLQDEEDEEEEDFEPSEDDDDGSGSGSSEDESDDDNDAPKAKRKSTRNLVEDELGSEAEDVEVTDDEDAGDDGEDEEEAEAEGGDEEDEDVEEQDEDEEMSEQATAPPAKTAAAAIPSHPPTQGRWGAPINNMPDPDDEDQL